MPMNITFDPVKDRLNIANHGVSLAVAADLEWDWIWVSEDAREAYGEQRWIGFAPIGQRIYCVVFTEYSGFIRHEDVRNHMKLNKF